MTHDANEKIIFSSGLEILQVKETFEWMVLQIYSGFAEGDAVAVNEYQVAIAGGVALGNDRNEQAKKAGPLIKKGLTGGIRYVALQRAKNARECVGILGKMYSEYGITYPSGVEIADPNEIWYIEPGGGHTWAAIRIPNDSYWIGANGYRIGEIDVNDKENVVTSPNLLEFVKEKGLWNPKEGPFNFAKAFGGGRENRYYDTRRVWSGIRHLSPSLNFSQEVLDFPNFLKPDNKLTVQKIIEVLRDRYERTEFAVTLKDGIVSQERQ